MFPTIAFVSAVHIKLKVTYLEEICITNMPVSKARTNLRYELEKTPLSLYGLITNSHTQTNLVRWILRLWIWAIYFKKVFTVSAEMTSVKVICRVLKWIRFNLVIKKIQLERTDIFDEIIHVRSEKLHQTDLFKNIRCLLEVPLCSFNRTTW